MNTELELAIRRLLKSVLLEVARELQPSRQQSIWEKPDESEFDERLLLRTPEVAESLGICERTIHAMTKSGVLPCVRIGRLVRYSLESIREWTRKSEWARELERDSRPMEPPEGLCRGTAQHSQSKTENAADKAFF